MDTRISLQEKLVLAEKAHGTAKMVLETVKDLPFSMREAKMISEREAFYDVKILKQRIEYAGRRLTGTEPLSSVQFYEAGERLKAAEAEIERTNGIYKSAINLGLEDERRSAYNCLTAARQAKAEADRTLTQLQDNATENVAELSEFDIYEKIEPKVKAAIESGQLESDKIGGGAKEGAKAALKAYRGSFTIESESIAMSERLRASAEFFDSGGLSKDEALFIFGREAEAMAERFISNQAGRLTKDIEFLRKSRRENTGDPDMLEGIEAELAERQIEYDTLIDNMTATIMENDGELPEVAKLFMDDRSEYLRRKSSGLKSLLGV